MDHKTENQLSYGWMKGFSTVQLELFLKVFLSVLNIYFAFYRSRDLHSLQIIDEIFSIFRLR